MNNNGDLQTGRNREKHRLYAIVLSRREALSQFFEKILSFQKRIYEFQKSFSRENCSSFGTKPEFYAEKTEKIPRSSFIWLQNYFSNSL